MSNHVNPLLWQFPLTVLACVVSSLAGAWAVSRLLDFAMNASAVAALSAVLSSAFIARDLRAERKHATRSAP
ncbi:MAG: hypothetical protein HY824_05430 [Acidobacteria bacterium]|nr:hypothetical protein [Acidobacteriota bacterium]